MPRFHGVVGFGDSVESPPRSGVWKDDITEISYFGDVIRNSRRSEAGEKVIPDISVSNSISIVADPYARDHFIDIRYVSWLGKLWTVQTVEVELPRLILRLGEVYNGPTPSSAGPSA